MKKSKALVCLCAALVVHLSLRAQLKEIRAIQQQVPNIKDSFAYVDALNRLGMLYHLKSIDTCFYYAQKARPVADRLKYLKGQAGALNNLGIAHLLKKNTYLASKYFNSALDIYKKTNNSAGECQLLMNIGITMATDNKMAECRKYLTSAYYLGNTLKDDSIQALVIINMVNDTATIQADSMMKLLDKAKTIATRYHDYRCLAAIEETKADGLIKEGSVKKGVEMLKNALQAVTALGMEYQKIGLDADIADAMLNINDTSAAMYYYKDALETAVVNGYEGLELDLAQKLYNYYTGTYNTAAAQLYGAMLIKTYKKYQDAMQQSGADYLDYSLKIEEFENLKSNSRANTYIIIVLSALCLAIIALLFFMMRSQQSRKKYVELLKERNEQAGTRNAELQHKNDFNNRLISLLAHDFRQPLAAVKGMMALLKEPGALSKEEMDFLVSRIETSSDTSLEIFDNILHWIKKQVSGFVYDPANLPLKNLVNEAGRSLQYITDKFQITIMNNIADATEILADKEMLQFVNRNLIHNAIKFSPNKATVTVSAVKSGNEMIVSVKDQGKGMTKEKLESLFNIFSKAQYTSDKEKGSGVALVICKDFLERMHGRIWAESEPGLGTTFLYALPVKD